MYVFVSYLVRNIYNNIVCFILSEGTFCSELFTKILIIILFVLFHQQALYVQNCSQNIICFDSAYQKLMHSGIFFYRSPSTNNNTKNVQSVPKPASPKSQSSKNCIQLGLGLETILLKCFLS